jgi:dipeptidyl aminopeptidase/acylaminoacyl peptidase
MSDALDITVTAFMRRLATLTLLALLLPTVATGDDGGKTNGARQRLTPQALWEMKRLGSPQVSPDGRSVVFTVQEWSITKNRSTTNLWLADVATGATRRLTTAEASDGSPRWDPQGRRIAFTSRRGDDENPALYVISVDGGEAQKIVELPLGVREPRWLPDGRGLLCVTTVIPSLAGTLSADDLVAMKKETNRRRDSKMTARSTENRQYRYFDHYLTDDHVHRLVRVDVETKAVRDLTPGYDRRFTIDGEMAYDISPDGGHVAIRLNTSRPPYRDFHNEDIYLVSADGSGTMKNLTGDNAGDDGLPRFAPDGTSLMFTRTETPYYAGEFPKLWRHDLASGRNTPVTESLDYGIADVEFSADGKTLWVTAEDKGVVPVFRLNADGTGLTPVHSTGTSTALSAESGTLAFLNDSTSRPNELFVLTSAGGPARQITHVNDDAVAKLDLGKVESYWFKGAGGRDIHGWLVFPPGYDQQKRYPLVQLMHGGPHTMNRDSWSYRWNTHLLASPGYVVTWVNRHGSTGFGEQFSSSIVNQWGDMPFEDIMKSTDYLLATYPNLDKDRLAAAGASYGGYMATWVLGHTDRFKAIINHAGVNNSYSQFASDAAHGLAKVMGGTPWENVEGLQRNNPMFYASRFKTPTLVIHGELDYRVPFNNGLELYNVLQAMGVPSRLVAYPDENHWILKPQNAIHWHWEMQSWLARHIGGEPIAKPVFEGEGN